MTSAGTVLAHATHDIEEVGEVLCRIAAIADLGGHHQEREDSIEVAAALPAQLVRFPASARALQLPNRSPARPPGCVGTMTPSLIIDGPIHVLSREAVSREAVKSFFVAPSAPGGPSTG